MTFAPAARRDRNELTHSSWSILRKAALSASIRDLMGSSMIMSSQGLPVTPALTPLLFIPPRCPRISNSSARRTPGSSVIPNRLSPYSSTFCRFRRPNRWAKGWS